MTTPDAGPTAAPSSEPPAGTEPRPPAAPPAGPEPSAGTPPQTGGRAPRSRLRQTVGDMVRSLVLVLAVVAVILVITLRPHPDPVRVIDYAPPLAQARAAASYDVLAPVNLGADWRATSARWEPTEKSGQVPAWHLGMITPDDQYVQVSQAATVAPAFVDEQTLGGRPAGDVTVAGTTWTRYETPDERSLVRQQSGVTTVVTGTAPWDELEAFAGTLRGG